MTKESLPRLVEYLVAYADNSFEKVRAFYVWISHNIKYVHGMSGWGADITIVLRLYMVLFYII